MRRSPVLSCVTGVTKDDPPPAPGAPPPDLLNGASLFLDFDGTLVELAPTPDAISIDALLPPILRGLMEALEGRVAIVSGRPLAQIRHHLGEAIAVSGSHGLETGWPDGSVDAPPAPAWIDEAVAAGEELARRHPGMVIERKPFGIALHYRRAHDAAADAEALAREIAGKDKVMQPGKMVFEVRVSGADKGAAVRRFMAAAPFAGTRPVFLGDDVTDEAGFGAAAALGGVGVLVGAARPTAAAFRLDDVAMTLRWLGAAAKAHA